jgi:hypothetical protein
MPILESASAQDLKRLLELFPVAALKDHWPNFKGTKEEIGFAIAGERDLGRITSFVDQHISCCRQHVHVFDPPDGAPTLPTEMGEASELVHADANHALFLTRFQYRVVLRDPLEESTLDFLWPARVDHWEGCWVLRLVVIEKNLASYFDRDYYLGGRSVEEVDLVYALSSNYMLGTTDLNKGVKTLWGDGFMDSPRVNFKKTLSTAREAMDEELGIREHNPELYEVLLEAPLYSTLFRLAPERGHQVSVISIDPSKGSIAFPRYTEVPGDTDHVIREILKRNQ